MGKFVEISKTQEIPVGVMNGFEVEGKEILVANYEGKYYAIGKKCTHMGADLSKGKLEGRIVTCPRHHSQVDVTNGKFVKGPAKKNAPSYEMKVEDQVIKVNI